MITAVKSMDDIVALCKRRGFVFPASEIYGGINGFWDYGPLGTTLKNNLRDKWWRDMVECPPDGPDGKPLEIVGLDSAIIQNPKVWEASGHVGGFNDPMVEDKDTKNRVRADHIYGANISSVEVGEEAAPEGWIPDITIVATSPGEAIANLMQDRKLQKGFGITHVAPHTVCENTILVKLKGETDDHYAFITAVPMQSLEDHAEEIPSPFTGRKGSMMKPRQFNLMFKTYVGALQNEESIAYLRPETAQGIFINYKNVLDTMRVRMPFGIAQIGKSFRNEVTPRNFIFRSREFEQMEMEWFCHPDDAKAWYEFWVETRLNWWKSLGVTSDNLIRREHDEDELAHYSTACADVEYQYPFTAPGYGELEGIAHRGNFDLTQHQEHSKTKLEYFDQPKNERYMPHVIEPAAGLTRGVLVLLCEAFTPDDSRPSKVYMKFHPKMAPIQAAVFPLVAKEGMPDVAEKLYKELRTKYRLQFDVKQNIGKRYARMDEVGTPFCFTIDGDTLTDNTVTVRYRDTLEQDRIGIDKVGEFLAEKIDV